MHLLFGERYVFEVVLGTVGVVGIFLGFDRVFLSLGEFSVVVGLWGYAVRGYAVREGAVGCCFVEVGEYCLVASSPVVCQLSLAPLLLELLFAGCNGGGIVEIPYGCLLVVCIDTGTLSVVGVRSVGRGVVVSGGIECFLLLFFLFLFEFLYHEVYLLQSADGVEGSHHLEAVL